MAFPKKYNTVIINLLLAVVICLVINFSYLLAIREQDNRDFGTSGQLPEDEGPRYTGVLHISKDGYGYLVGKGSAIAPTDSLAAQETTDSLASQARGAIDSIYVTGGLIRRLSLTDGSNLEIVTREPGTPGGHPVMWRLVEMNGVPFDYGKLYDSPSDDAVMALQIAFYVVFAFLLLTIMTAGGTNNVSMRFYLTRAAYCIVAGVLLWLLLPIMRPRSGELIVTAMNLPRAYSVDILKCSFVLVFALLYGRTFQLIYQKEGIMLENEQLKNENLAARYNSLINQINPHFLFNSLNSLSSLVREGKNDDAVKYIDRLSDTFRYTIQSGSHTTTTLAEELEFVNAYKYLLEVRYDEKLFIDIAVDENKLTWLLPTFSIQPLIENAVKHNTITRAKPLRISICTEGDMLVVSNPVNPKIEPEKGTGIGLANLGNRWHLLTGKNIEVTSDGRTFSVSLPFIKRGN